MNKIFIFLNALTGELIKLFYSLVPLSLLLSKRCVTSEKVIVSLTSYGDRVNRIAKYAIISILRQTVRPHKIILWLDSDKWGLNSVPRYLLKMSEYGVEVRFCSDGIRSYTKLIPTLKEYPDNLIVTIDDDIYYSSNLIEELLQCHEMYPDKIIAVQFCLPSIDRHGNLKPYVEWKEFNQPDSKEIINTKLLFPQGVGGVLYPPGALHDEVFNIDVFKRMCKYADDIWFFIMGLLNNSDKAFVTNLKIRHFNIDLFRQILMKDRLHDSNASQGGNDIQLQRVLNHYNIDLTTYE